jgi:hypothetical protein
MPFNPHLNAQANTGNRYSLLQIFSKFGKVTKLDFLFHKTGLLKGKPRGYAFVEYGNKDVRFLSSSLYPNTLSSPGPLFIFIE